LRKGVCSKYGIYCAKAHNENEIRNLVTIYGKDWKRHYEAYQVCDSENPIVKKSKRKRIKHTVSDFSYSQSSTGEDICLLTDTIGMSDLSYQMYGGSPLFVPTPPESPSFESSGECSEQQDSSRIDYLPFLDLNVLGGDESAVCDGEVSAGTVSCGKEEKISTIRPPKRSSISSLFEDGSPWAFDWSSPLKGTVSKETGCSSCGTDDPKSIAFKDSGSWSSGNGYSYALSSTSSISDQEIELCKIKEQSMTKKAIGCGISDWDNLPDDQVVYKSLVDLDQQDWELKLGEHGCENEFNVDCIFPIFEDELEKLEDVK